MLLLRALQRQAAERSLSVYLVGGPVRDVLLGIPIKDLDLVVEGDAPGVARRLAEELDGRALVHPQFGTATVILDDSRVDLVSARREVYPQPGALPQVSPGNIDDDLSRRDFSINALAVSLSDSSPRVLDPYGGVTDIEQGVVRVLHRQSFVDDPTRILRAVRYEQRLGFRIEDETLALMQETMTAGHMTSLSGDRLRHELEHILREARPAPVLARAMDLGILAAIHPSLANDEALTYLGRMTAVQSAPQEPSAAPIDDASDQYLAYLSALAYPLSRDDGEGAIQRLNLPGAWAVVVRDTIALRNLEPELASQSLPSSRLVRLVEGLSADAVLAVSRITRSSLVGRCLEDYLHSLRHITPALDGGDLLAMGVPSGPLVGEILEELRDARMDLRVTTADQERNLVHELLAGSRGEPSRG